MKKIIHIALMAFLALGLISSVSADTTITCDNCGKKFTVPDDMYNFACPYCGFEYDSWYCSVCGAINYVPLAWDSWECWNCGTVHELWYCGSCGAENFVPSSWNEFDCWECGAHNTK